MTDNDRQDFDQMIIDFCQTMGVYIQATTFWWSTLQSYDFSEVKKALEESARDYSNLKQKPTPAEIRMRIVAKKRSAVTQQEQETDLVPCPPEILEQIKTMFKATTDRSTKEEIQKAIDELNAFRKSKD